VRIENVVIPVPEKMRDLLRRGNVLKKDEGMIVIRLEHHHVLREAREISIDLTRLLREIGIKGNLLLREGIRLLVVLGRDLL